LDYYIIKLILQPLIENSIYHGIKEKEGKCQIKIILGSKDEKLCLKIIDSGKGISKEKLKQINCSLNSDENPSPGLHIGVKNVYKRLKLVYEEECNLVIKSKEYFGTCVTILLPYDTSTEIKNFGKTDNE